MNTITTLFIFLAGLLLRLGIPILVTVLLITYLRRLDARWQAEAQRETVSVQKPECWKIKGCTPDQLKNCTAGASSLPCWQAYRKPNGYLREQCFSCEVFIDAPIPALKIETRRM